VYHELLKDSFKQNADRGKKVKNQAALRYWTALEQRAEPVLLHQVALGETGRGEDDQMKPWREEVRKAAHDAYDFACPHGTPRQLRAYAAGLVVLRSEKQPKSKTEVAADDKDSNDGGEE